MGDAEGAFREWAVVELFGHKTVAGLLTEVEVAGHGLLRLDVPAVDDDPDRPGSTHFYAPSAVYGIHPCPEATARAVATQYRPDPVSYWDIPELRVLRREREVPALGVPDDLSGALGDTGY